MISNALDAVAESVGGRVGVRLSQRSTAGKTEAVIEVSDTGGGIAEADAASIFYAFYTTKETGTGLGLAAVKRIAEAHQGGCAVESSISGGSIFTLYLPFDLET